MRIARTGKEYLDRTAGGLSWEIAAHEIPQMANRFLVDFDQRPDLMARWIVLFFCRRRTPLAKRVTHGPP